MSHYNLPFFEKFRFWCQKVLPLVYDNSLSYYEVLCKVISYLNVESETLNEIIKILEGSGIDIDEAVDKVIEKLEEDHIIQDEVEDALAQAIAQGDIDERCAYVFNQMISGGDADSRINTLIADYINNGNADTHIDAEIAEYINNGNADTYINGLIDTKIERFIKTYNTFLSIPVTGLQAGQLIRTKGYRGATDGGGGLYMVYDKEGSPYHLTNGSDENGYAFRIMDGATAKKGGAYGDGTHPDDVFINNLILDYRVIDMGDARYNYLIQNTLTLSSNRHLFGNGCKITRDTNMNLDPALQGYGSTGNFLTNVEIEGIEFLPHVNSQQKPCHCLDFSQCSGLIVRDCVIRDVYGYGIRCNLCNSVTLSNVRIISARGITGNPGGGLFIHCGYNISIDNCYGTDLMDHLIYLDGSSEDDQYNLTNVSVNGCVTRFTDIEDALTGAASIVAYGDVKRLSIVNCNFYSVKQGIAISDRRNLVPTGVSISNCNFFESTDDAIFIHNGSGVARVHSQAITIANCNFVNIGQDCVDIRTGKGIIITACNMSQFGRYGVSMSDASEVTVLNNNMNEGAEGVLVGRNSEDSDNVVVANNLIGNCSQYGIYLMKGSNIRVEGNVYHGNFGYTQVTVQTLGVTGIGEGLSSDSARSIYWNTAAPSSGYYQRGDIVLDTSGTVLGWHCTAGGHPGTWAAIIPSSP